MTYKQLPMNLLIVYPIDEVSAVTHSCGPPPAVSQSCQVGKITQHTCFKIQKKPKEKLIQSELIQKFKQLFECQ